MATLRGSREGPSLAPSLSFVGHHPMQQPQRRRRFQEGINAAFIGKQIIADWRGAEEDFPAARARNETQRATRHYGRAFWKRWTGYRARSRAEARMRCLKSFGERIAARHPDRQTAEIHIRVALMNRFNALGTAEIVRIVRP
jgi:hypothetical protein